MNIFLDIINVKTTEDLIKMSKVLDDYGFIWSGSGGKITLNNTVEHLKYGDLSFQLWDDHTMTYSNHSEDDSDEEVPYVFDIKNDHISKLHSMLKTQGYKSKVPVKTKTRMRVTPTERELVELYRAFNRDLDKQEDLIKEKDMLVAKIENIQFDLKGKSDAIKELIEGEY